MLATNSKFRIPNSQLHGALVVFLACATLAAQPQLASKKHVLAWADVRNGYQHDSISHAVAVIERLGRESGAYDTFIRTDSQLITKQPITFPAGTGIATGEQFNVRNLDYFDAIFFFGVRESDLTPEQRARLILRSHALHAREVRFSWRDREFTFQTEPEPWFVKFHSSDQPTSACGLEGTRGEHPSAAHASF